MYLQRLHAAVLAWRTVSVGRLGGDRRLTGDRGEGVISAAIAVLIMAAIGVLAYAGFQAIFSDASDAARDKVSQIN